jgi:hypothetical protein
LFADKGNANQNKNNEESIIIEFFKTWQTVILSLVVILFGSIGVVKAIQYRLEEDRKRLGLPLEESETVNDWVSKFTKKSKPKVIVESQTIDSEGFEKKFIKKPNDVDIIDKTGPSKFAVEKASLSLDKAITEDTLNDIVELADEFESRMSKLGQNKKSNDED